MEFQYDGKIYPVILEHKRVKNINMHVRPDGTIYVSAPFHTKEAYIQECLEKHAERFAKASDRLATQKKSSEETDGAVKSFLGEEISLRWSDKPCQSTLQDGVLTVFARNSEEAAYAWRRWCADECVKLCQQLNPEVYKAFRAAGYQVPLSRIEIKDMTSRWGSCTASKARISINVRLMSYPKGCIRSVFFHEYTHFLHHNHGSGFYAVLLKMCPDYAHWDSILKGGS